MSKRPPLPPLYRLVRALVRAIFTVAARMDVGGLENIPDAGPFIVASNHMHVLDLPVIFAVIPHRQTVFAASKWRDKFAGWLMRVFGNAIFVERGEPDRQAITQALRVLANGGVLGVAPEGTRSRTGGLLPGKSGTVYLASRSGAPILPIVAWGQEQVLGAWARLRRPTVHVRIAPLLTLPPETERAKASELAPYTDLLMMTLARMLPPEYRGFYAERVAELELRDQASEAVRATDCAD